MNKLQTLWQQYPLPISVVAAVLVLLFLLLLLRRKKSSPRSVIPLTLEKSQLSGKLASLWQSRDKGAWLAELEALLIQADVGIAVTGKLLARVQQAGSVASLEDLKAALHREMLAIFQSVPAAAISGDKPQVLMIVGVNGAGKTTSIGKLAWRFQRAGEQVLLAAADTFRAGAVSQLKVWAERVDVPILIQQDGADPAAVAFDAVKSGQAKQKDRVLIDTAGRLHTKVNLMEELKKVKRVLGKAMDAAPHATWLVIDGTQGQNALQQARQFHEALELTGVVITKLDGTPKGGIVLAIADELKIPIVFIGVGEKLEDLRPFEPEAFVQALLGD